MHSEKVIYVLVLSGPLKDHKFFVKSNSPILVGRGEDANIKIAYDYCSRKHASIYWENNNCFIKDLNSTNGTFLNDTRFRGKKELKNKDIIGLGNTKLIVLITHSPKEKRRVRFY